MLVLLLAPGLALCAWTFVLPRLTNVLEEVRREQILPFYAGRGATASPATGLLKVHEAEQRQLVDRALAQPSTELLQPFRRLLSKLLPCSNLIA